MAGSNGTTELKDKLQKRTEAPEAGVGRTVKGLLSQEGVRKRFEDILGQKAAGFISSIINTTNASPRLRDCDPMTVVGAAAIAASLDLPIDPNLGFAWIIPYKDGKRGMVARFQIGYKGYIQLALRSGQYKTINVGVVYEGEIEEPTARERLTGEVRFSGDGRTSDVVVGYAAYFRLVNGAEMWDYMSTEEVVAHAQRFSAESFRSPRSAWNTDRDAMGCKTVLARLISHYGILSVEMQKAQSSDGGVVLDDAGETVDHPDVIDAAFSEVDGEGVRGAENEDADPEQEGAAQTLTGLLGDGGRE